MATEHHLAGATAGYAAGFSQFKERLIKADGEAELLGDWSDTVKSVAIAVASAALLKGLALRFAFAAFIKESPIAGELFEISIGKQLENFGKVERVDFRGITSRNIHPSFFNSKVFEHLVGFGKLVNEISALSEDMAMLWAHSEWFLAQAKLHEQAKSNGRKPTQADIDIVQVADVLSTLRAWEKKSKTIDVVLVEQNKAFKEMIDKSKVPHEYDKNGNDPDRAEKDIWWLWLASLEVPSSAQVASSMLKNLDEDKQPDWEDFLRLTFGLVAANSAGIIDRGPIEDRLEELGFAKFGFMTDVGDVARLIKRAKKREKLIRAKANFEKGN